MVGRIGGGTAIVSGVETYKYSYQHCLPAGWAKGNCVGQGFIDVVLYSESSLQRLTV